MDINADELREYLDARRGATFVHLYAVTDPTDKMLKADNPYWGKTVHIWSRNVTFGASYMNSVNRRWNEAGVYNDKFVPSRLWNGKGVKINPYMNRHVDTGQEYLFYQLKTDADGVELPPLFEEYRHFVTGELLDQEDVESYFKGGTPSKKQRVKEYGCKETFPRRVKVNGGKLGCYKLGLYQINIDHNYFAMEGMELRSA